MVLGAAVARNRLHEDLLDTGFVSSVQRRLEPLHEDLAVFPLQEWLRRAEDLRVSSAFEITVDEEFFVEFFASLGTDDRAV